MMAVKAGEMLRFSPRYYLMYLCKGPAHVSSRARNVYLPPGWEKQAKTFVLAAHLTCKYDHRHGCLNMGPNKPHIVPSTVM